MMSLSPAGLLACAFLLVPLLPFHYLPILSFRAEWVFAVICSFGWFLTKGNVGVPAFSRTPALWMVAIVAIAAVVSSVLGQGYGAEAVMVPIYCAFAASIYALVRALCGHDGEAPSLARSLAIAMLFSGLLAAIPAAFQLNRWDTGLLLVLPRGNLPSVVGNIGQANQFGDWMWLAITAAAFLGAGRCIGKITAVLAMAPLTLFAITTGSRSVWLYPLVVLFGVWLVGRKDDEVTKHFSRLIFSALVMQGLVHLVLVALGGYDAFGLVSSVDRLGERGNAVDGNIRTAIWLRTLEVVKDTPWLGSGPGSFRYISLEKLLENGGGVVPVGEHAHNLFLQFAMEYGVPVAALFAVACCWWMKQCFAGRLSGAGIWSFSSILVIGIHSMLEYPLWFAYFLGIAAVHLAIVDEHLNTERMQKIVLSVWAQRMLALLSVIALIVIGMQYRTIELPHEVMRYQMASGIGAVAGLPHLNDEMLEAVDSIPEWSPWRSKAEAVTILGAFPNRDDAYLWRARCGRVIRLDDSSLVLARCSMVMALSGDEKEANRIAELGCLDYPRKSDRFPELMVRLSRLMNVTSMPRASCLPVMSGSTAVAGPIARSASADGSEGGSGGQ